MRRMESLQLFSREPSQDHYDVAVIGSGPAGTTAGLYAARGGHSTIIIDKAPTAGALAITQRIANYPGVEEDLTGMDLLERMWRQAARFGAEFLQSQVLGLDLSGEDKTVFTATGPVRARTVIITTGARSRSRKIPGEDRFLGRGVSYCATCDAPFFQDAEVAVIGDNAEAVEEAGVLARFARRVHLLVPGRSILGWWEEDASALDPRITVHHRARPVAIEGEAGVTGVRFRDQDGEERWLPVRGVFIFLSGSGPSTDFIGDELPRDDDGYLIVNEEMATPVPGVYAAGDVRRTPVKQAVLAAADGALAAIAADRYLRRRERLVAQR